MYMYIDRLSHNGVLFCHLRKHDETPFRLNYDPLGKLWHSFPMFILWMYIFINRNEARRDETTERGNIETFFASQYIVVQKVLHWSPAAAASSQRNHQQYKRKFSMQCMGFCGSRLYCCWLCCVWDAAQYMVYISRFYYNRLQLFHLTCAS